MRGPEGSLEFVTPSKPFITLPAKELLAQDAALVHQYGNAKPLWKWSFNGDWHSMTVFCNSKPPNKFYRFMMRRLLNIHTQLIAGSKP